MTREAVAVLIVEAFKARMDRAVGSLIYLVTALPAAGRLELVNN